MSKIAVLDTEIYPEGLQCGKFLCYNICHEDKEERCMHISHGTVCARVLDQFAADYELVSIRILTDTEKGKPTGLICHLREGLELCLALDVDIVCLSAVSSVLSDSEELFSVTQQLAGKSVIVSALDNRGYITVPTSYPFVVGVQSDRKNRLSPGELAYRKGDAFFTEVYANCDIALLRQLHHSPSNSFAVPVAAAQINNWINQKKNIRDCLQQLRAYPAIGSGEYKKDFNMIAAMRELPIVAVYGSDDRNTYVICQRAMDQLYHKYRVQSSALCSIENGYDIRFRNVKSAGHMPDGLSFMEKHYKTDLIFIVIKEKERIKVLSGTDVDVEIAVYGSDALLSFEGRSVREHAEKIADRLIQILQ